MKLLLFLFVFLFSLFTGFTEVCGKYYGDKNGFGVEIKLYDDSTFRYTRSDEFPVEVSEGTWVLRNDTVIMNSTPCKDPEALQHVPVRTYLTITDGRYVYRKNSLTPIGSNGKAVKSEILQKASEE
ncbi:MAG TPA: hypothetical protein VK826_15040 [Bacteroidia bacterium]|nr:hypothetical protein [Bacteroidia bacterium]